MNARINDRGQLIIQRTTISDSWIPQWCHIGRGDACDVFCPLFGEPIKKRVMNGVTSGGEIIELPLCKTVLILKTLEVANILNKSETSL